MAVGIAGHGYEFNEEMGMFVNAAHRRVVEIIKDIDPELELLWNAQNKTFQLAHLGMGKEPYIITTFPEELMDHRIVEVVLNAKAAAQGRPGELADKLDRAEAARRMVELKEAEDMIEEERDKAKFLWTTPLHNVRLDGKTYRL